VTFDNLRIIESILALGTKGTTYKLVLLRAILDHMIESNRTTAKYLIDRTRLTRSLVENERDDDNAEYSEDDVL
jgi:hypothetical protein